MKEIIVNGYPLDKEQLKPIIENQKYSLIIAGAGSGKTLTLIGKIKYLLENNIYKKEEICCISFTNEATNNLKQNIKKNCNTDITTVTFHKLALLILDIEKIEFEIAPSNLLQLTIETFFENQCYNNKEIQNIIFQLFSFSIFKTNKTWKKIITSKEFTKFKRTILTFISLMKCNGYEKEEFKNFFKQKKFQNYLIIIYAIYTIYETNLLKNELLDFDDIILLATKTIKEKDCHLPFKIIIIDEFQDTSLSRFNLIREIINQNNASLCVVGDDYQSIYHFSGCDLNLFLHFQDYFKNAKIYKLEKTYRNSEELIKTSGTFIQKNKSQIKKELTSDKHLKNPIILTYYKNENKVLEKIISKIPKEKQILIIGRNNFDLKKYLKNIKYTITNNEIKLEKYKEHNIKYLTIHKSKGLESDVVILLNVSNELYGIPTKIKEEKILSLIKKEQPYPYEEERRLFYVALTRTKSYIYILIPKKTPSIFIKELKKMKNVTKIHYE